MTDTQQAPPEPAWGAPQPANAKWSTRKTVAAAGIALALAAGGGAVIYAATSGDSNHMQGGPGGFGGPGGPGGPGGFGGQRGSAMPAALHGEFVVSDGNGGYTTELTQTGTVTAISDTAITAQSADQYTHTYVIDSATQQQATVAVGNTTTIAATVSGDTATATRIGGTESGPGGPMAGSGGPPMSGQQPGVPPGRRQP